MSEIKNWLFLIGFSMLATHELDAVTHAEWRILVAFRELPEAFASFLFVAVHVPLFAFILWFTTHKNIRLRQWSRTGLAVFLIIHVGLHRSLEYLSAYSFYSPLSITLIYGGGVIGACYVVATIMGRTSSPGH